MEKLKILFNKYHYQKKPDAGYILFFILTALASFFYFIAISIKNFLYKIKILKEKQVAPFVICVGNLTTGGVGKTPIVCEIADYLANTLKQKTTIISRGYNSKLDNKKINVIKDKDGTYFDDGTICGDEALLIANNTKNSIVIVCKDRAKAAEFAYKKYGAKVVILDDGFSNRKIKKDFSVLVVDSKKMFGNNFTLPLGPLREPVYEAKRADYIIVSNKNDKNAAIALDKISKKLKTKQISCCNFVYDYFYNIKNSLQIIPQNTKAGAFCAIGQPEQFYKYLNEHFDIIFTKSYADHHSYTKEDLDTICKEIHTLDTDTLITTQKDEVKIKHFVKKINDTNFLSLKLKADFEDKGLFYAIEKRMREYAP